MVCVARDRASELLFEGLIHQAKRGMPPGPVAPFRRSVLVQQVLAYLQQVSKHRRTRKQFEAVFSRDEDPKLDTSIIGAVLEDMEATNLLTSRRDIYCPATEGSTFIESSCIYGNISQSSPEIALVDADTGRTVAFVRDIDAADGGIRVAGQSFEVLQSRTTQQQLVRAGGKHLGRPKYYSRSFPYACDVGVCVSSRLGVRSNQLLVQQRGTSLEIMTWLGRLLNLALAESLKHLGHSAKPFAFALHTQDVQSNDVLVLVRRAVQLLSENNPLGNVTVEKTVDVGPYFTLLTEVERKEARKDWLDLTYLKAWADGLTEVWEPDGSLAADVSALASL